MVETTAVLVTQSSGLRRFSTVRAPVCTQLTGDTVRTRMARPQAPNGHAGASPVCARRGGTWSLDLVAQTLSWRLLKQRPKRLSASKKQRFSSALQVPCFFSSSGLCGPLLCFSLLPPGPPCAPVHAPGVQHRLSLCGLKTPPLLGARMGSMQAAAAEWRACEGVGMLAAGRASTGAPVTIGADAVGGAGGVEVSRGHAGEPVAAALGAFETAAGTSPSFVQGSSNEEMGRRESRDRPVAKMPPMDDPPNRSSDETKQRLERVSSAPSKLKPGGNLPIISCVNHKSPLKREGWGHLRPGQPYYNLIDPLLLSFVDSLSLSALPLRLAPVVKSNGQIQVNRRQEQWSNSGQPC